VLRCIWLLLQGVWAQAAQQEPDSEDEDGDGAVDGDSSGSDDEAAAGSSSDAGEEAGSDEEQQQQQQPAANGHAAGSDSSDDEGPPEEHSSRQQQQAFQKQPKPSGKHAAAAGREGGEDSSDDDDGAADAEGAGLDPERVLLYERSKLRWYYAVVECDDRATASRLYEACDGIEFERSACKFDLRWGTAARGVGSEGWPAAWRCSDRAKQGGASCTVCCLEVASCLFAYSGSLPYIHCIACPSVHPEQVAAASISVCMLLPLHTLLCSMLPPPTMLQVCS
jgi:hypothetical protein